MQQCFTIPLHDLQAYVLQEQDSLTELVDPSLGSDYPEKEALQMLNLALLCTSPSPTLRPTMSGVVSVLEGETPIQIPSVKPVLAEGERLRFKAFEKLSYDSGIHTTSTEACLHSSASACSMDIEKIDAPFSSMSIDGEFHSTVKINHKCTVDSYST